MEALGNAVHLVLRRSESTAGGRERGTGWNAVVAVEELAAAGDAVDEQCSRVEVVAGGAEAEDPAARGGDDGDHQQPQHRVPLCILHSVDGPW
jgi:hypothetical protein